VGHYCDLKLAELSDFRQNVAVIGTKCCSEFDKLDGTILPLEEALNRELLPHTPCAREYGYIRCYGFKGVRDKYGRLIPK